MERTGKSYTVKKWFADKVAQEMRRNINMCDVFAIVKESEKAVYAMLNLGCDFRKTMWIPKSALVENEVGEDASGEMHYETIKADYNEAVKKFAEHWDSFR